MVDPHEGFLDFQRALEEGRIKLEEIEPANNLYRYHELKGAGGQRMAYVSLGSDNQTITAYAVCALNGYIDGCPILALGYATPANLRNQGKASKIVKEVVRDTGREARRLGLPKMYIEAVVDIENIPSQRVAEKALGVKPDLCVESISGRPARRYLLEVSAEP